MARRKRRPPEVQRVFDHLNRANREMLKGVERFAEVDDKIGVLPGHRVEMVRRLERVRDELTNAVKAFTPKEEQDD